MYLDMDVLPINMRLIKKKKIYRNCNPPSKIISTQYERGLKTGGGFSLGQSSHISWLKDVVHLPKITTET